MPGMGVPPATALRSTLTFSPVVLPALPFWLLMLAPLATPLPAQLPPPLKIEVREVTVDITVYDGNGYTSRGNPVSGLHQGDFEVFEDGKRMVIKSFAEHQKPAPGEEPPPPTLIVFDLASTGFDAQAYTRSQIKRFLETIPPGSPIAIAALTPGLCFVHGFTTEPSVLLASFDKVGDCTHIRPSPFLESAGEQQAHQQQVGQVRDAAALDPKVAGMADQLDRVHDTMLAVQAQQRTTNTLSAFEALARYLSAYPGRKNLVWLGENFTARPFGLDTEESEQFQHVASLFAAARVAVYPIDDGGLVAPHALPSIDSLVAVRTAQSAEQALEDKRVQSSLQRNSFKGTMDEIAERTGGEAFYETNSIVWAMSRVVNNANSYYTLTYSPAEPGKSKPYHRINVRLTRDIGTHRLTYRRGYFTSDRPESPLQALLDPGMPTLRQIHFLASVRRSNTMWTPDPIGASSLRERDEPDAKLASPSTVLAGYNHELAGNQSDKEAGKEATKVRRFYFSLAVALPDLRLQTTADGIAHGSLDFGVIAYDEQGKPVNWLSKHFTPSLSAADRDQMSKVGLQLSESLDLPPGKYMVRVGIYDELSGHATTSDTVLDNPAHL